MNTGDRGLPHVGGRLPGVCTLGGRHSVGVAGVGGRRERTSELCAPLEARSLALIPVNRQPACQVGEIFFTPTRRFNANDLRRERCL